MAQTEQDLEKDDNFNLSKNIMKIYEPYFLIFPDYYQIFVDLLNKIIYEDNDSPFSLQYKVFFGIMASSTLYNEYLLDDFKRIFLLLGGEKSWIEQGLKCENIPEHIKGMSVINNILAHKPWIMDWRHFSSFKTGLSAFFFQSAIILTTIQRLAFISSSLNLIIHNDIVEEEKNKKLETIKVKKKEENEIKDEEKDDKLKEKEDDKKLYIDTKKKKYNKMEERIQNVITSVKKKYTENKEEDNKEENKDINKKDIFKLYISDLIISYSDFNPHIEKYLHLEDFNWEENAKYFYFDYAGKEMKYLDKELKFLKNMDLDSKNKKDEKKLDLFKLGGVIEKYIALIFGINDDVYNYHLTNEYIPVELKRIIKKIACGPETIKEQELSLCLEKLNKKELIYLIFEVTSIRQRISLTFFAKAFEDFTSNNILLKNNSIDN